MANKTRHQKYKDDPKYKEAVKRANKTNQQKQREEITDHYILQLVYNNLKYQTGLKYFFEEIRRDYPHLIEKKRNKILSNRAKNNK